MTALVATPTFEGSGSDGRRLALSRAARHTFRSDSGLGVALLLSAALHGALLLVAARFDLDAPRPLSAAQPVIDVTLLQWPMPADESPKPEATVPQAEPANMTVDARPQPNLGDGRPTAREEVAELPAPATAAEVTQETAPTIPGPAVFSANIRQMAREAARLGLGSAPPATNSRIRRIDAAAPETVTDAYYLDAWRRKVERIGQVNYPQEARERQLYGTLRLLVSIEPDGALRDVRLLASSGHDVLDEAAIRIVRLAAPFAPLPPAMEDLELLEIDRTWRFQRTRNARPGAGGAGRRRTRTGRRQGRSMWKPGNPPP